MKGKPHVVYKLMDGITRVPSVTTITGSLGWNKQILINWANRLGLEGTDVKEYVDDKADIGTIAHGFILEYHGGAKFDTTGYTRKQIKQANYSVDSYMAWLKDQTVEPLILETPIVSEWQKFGGTPDNYCLLNGKPTLLDYKTGSGIHADAWIQVGGGYKFLLEEKGHPVEEVIILHIPKAKGEAFKEYLIPEDKLPICWDIFKHALEIYKLKRRLKF